MKAVSIISVSKLGALKNDFKIRDMELPQPKANQIRVKTAYAAVNIDDIRIAEGNFIIKIKPSEEKPYVPGHDFSGLVDALGKDVTRFKLGDKVYGQTLPKINGGWAEYLIANEKQSGHIPDQWSMQQAASYAMGSLVAKAAIDKLADFSGQTGLIIGAAGSIGNMALQYLVQNNAKVWAVCSTGKVAMVKQLGAEKVIDYTLGPFEKQMLKDGSKIDFVIDFIGGEDTRKASNSILKKNGRFVTVVGPISFSAADKGLGNFVTLKVGLYFLWRLVILGLTKPKYYFAYMLQQGNFENPPLGKEIKPIIDSEHAFNEAGIKASIEKVESHRAAGKVLIKMS